MIGIKNPNEISTQSYLYLTPASRPCRTEANSVIVVGEYHKNSPTLLPPPQEDFSAHVPLQGIPDFLHNFSSSMSGISKSELSAAKLLKASRIGLYPVHLITYTYV